MKLSKFKEYLDENYIDWEAMNDHAADKVAEDSWDAALDQIKDSLAEKIKTEQGLFRKDDIHYVEWNEIEQTIDKLKADE